MTNDEIPIVQGRKSNAPVDHETQKFKLSTELGFQKTIIIFLMSVIVTGLVLPYIGSFLHNEVKIFDSTATLVQLLIQILSASLAYTLGASKDKDGNSQPGQPTRLNPPVGNPPGPGQQPGGYPPGQGGQPGPGQMPMGYPPQQGYQQPYQQPYQPQGQYVAPQYVQQATPGQLQPPFANPVQPASPVLQPGPATQPPPLPVPPRPPVVGGKG